MVRKPDSPGLPTASATLANVSEVSGSVYTSRQQRTDGALDIASL